MQKSIEYELHFDYTFKDGNLVQNMNAFFFSKKMGIIRVIVSKMKIFDNIGSFKNL